ncbi:MAG: malate synthase G [SAR86 cluster bacterium]|jgi:malate synthase|nr:MAG: malate synthase G [SAR86 cluster bacterium]|tara:strand:- start:2050 stop:4248 length:2199 start_codon:yes stop_codon:yes gene_type:complete
MSRLISSIKELFLNIFKSPAMQVDEDLKNFVNDELLNGLDITSDFFWQTLENLIYVYGPLNKSLLEKRKLLQDKIDEWHINNKDKNFNFDNYKNFLYEIGYIVPESDDFSISTKNVDPEISSIAGPQLVVPVMNARFALNAANARWGSLYDALYGTNIISEEDGASRVGSYNPARGEKVIAFAKEFLDKTIPLELGSFKNVTKFNFKDGFLSMILNDGTNTMLKDAKQYLGYSRYENDSFGLLFRNNNLHFEIQIDKAHPVGRSDVGGIKDIYMESAVTTIQDCEDSVAAVDGKDKVIVYRNWLGLMKGDLQETFIKDGQQMIRRLNKDRKYISPKGEKFYLPGRSLMLVRNVGHLMTNPAVIDKKGEEVPEGILDALFTICIAKHDLLNNGKFNNSRKGSIYIVKPKMHGPEEVKFSCDLFEAIEKALDIEPNTVKIGIMDEERRTTVNLKECIKVAKNRVIFINTGFLDRTGDEIHTSMEAGPMVRKDDMKKEPWIKAYENWNVDIGLESGFKGNAQIGKGMWPMPDEMLQMYETKTMHPKAGANCAWVPSPTAASIHAMHYHEIFVEKEQNKILSRDRAEIDDILNIPIIHDFNLSKDDINDEIENNCQGILGYVVRWIDQGIGCSKVPDINNIGLMEDRATCRISSQHIANWLHHGICNKNDVINAMKKMALVVDEQNSNDSSYIPMSPSFDGIAFQAACDLAIKGRSQPSGYTEPILHEMRLNFKIK